MKFKKTALCAAGTLAMALTGLAQPAAPQGFITVKEFLDIAGTAVPALTGSPKFPDNPDLEILATYFEWPQSANNDINTPPPGDVKNNYGVQIVGYLHPPTTGNYQFWISADDNAELWLSTDSDPANKVLIAREPQWNNPRDYEGIARRPEGENVSAEIPLQGGQVYYIEALMKEGGGGENLSVTWSQNFGLPIEGQYLSSSRATIGAPAIAVEPQDALTVEGGPPVTFSVVPDGPWMVQWTRTQDGTSVDIAGATGRDYVFSPTVADNGATYAARVTNDAGSTMSRQALLEVDAAAPEQLTQGFLRMEHYGGISGTVVETDLYSAPSYVNREFDYVTYVAGPNVPATAPNVDNFGRVLTGWVQPPTTGEYRFFTRSDDGSELHISTTDAIITDPENFLPAAMETGCCAAFQEVGDPRTSGTFNLTAGQRYGFTGAYKEGGGGDWFQAAWRLEGDATPAANLQPIPPPYVWTMASPAGQRAEITGQPASVTRRSGETATFTVAVATRPQANTFGVQWKRDGVDIPGATGASYTTPLLAPEDDGAEFTAVVYTLLGPLTAETATLTINPDNEPPVLVSAGALTGGTAVGLLFNERLDQASAETAGNYGVSGVTVTGARLLGEAGTIVRLTLSAAPTAGFTVTVDGVQDFSGNVLTGGTATGEISDMQAMDLIRAADGAGTVTDPIRPGEAVTWGGGGFFVAGGGADIWDSADGGHYVYKEWTGSFDMRAQVESLFGTHQWAKATLMARESLIGDNALSSGRNAAVAATRMGGNGNNQLTWQWRDVTAAGSGSLDGGLRPVLSSVAPYPNTWIRLVREDAQSNLLKAYWSNNGSSWNLLSEREISPGGEEGLLPETLYVGMAVTSHDNGPAVPLAEAVYQSFTITPWSPVSEPPVIEVAVQANGDLTITFEGTLQERDASGGDWSDTALTSPASLSPSESGKLYRAMQ